MTIQEAMHDLTNRVPSSQSEHAEPARLVLASALAALEGLTDHVPASSLAPLEEKLSRAIKKLDLVRACLDATVLGSDAEKLQAVQTALDS